MFGDNVSVFNSSMTPHGKTCKRNVALSFHRVRDTTAAKIIACNLINGKMNPVDILSKHWAHHSVWPILKPLLF